VRFIKDRSNGKNQWAWNGFPPSGREVTHDFTFNPKYMKPIAQILRSTLMALGHASSAQFRMVKVKSRNISPDGALGGKGYIQKITDLRLNLMNCVEALSAISDTLYDEVAAPHWDPAEDKLTKRDREEVRELIEDVEEIKEDPEAWAREEEAEEDSENKRMAGSRTPEGHFRRAASCLQQANEGLPALVNDTTPEGMTNLVALLRMASRSLRFVETSNA
tara:strand:+ start:188 stop:847 length:660 start_codon:yes stop_codon:yes gene_type:complete